MAGCIVAVAGHAHAILHVLRGGHRALQQALMVLDDKVGTHLGLASQSWPVGDAVGVEGTVQVAVPSVDLDARSVFCQNISARGDHCT